MDITEDELIEYLKEGGYSNFRDVPGIGLCCLSRFAFTVGVIIRPNRDFYEYRYCFQHLSDALVALNEWDGESDIPGPWIKKKGMGFDDANPNNPSIDEW